MITRFIVHENDFDTEEEYEEVYNKRYFKLGFLKDETKYDGFYKDVHDEIRLNEGDKVKIVNDYRIDHKSYCLMNNVIEYYIYEI